MEELDRISELLNKAKYKNHFKKTVNKYKISLTKKEYEDLIKESSDSVSLINEEFSNLKKDIKNKIKNHEEDSLRNKYYLSKYEILLREMITEYETHYNSQIDYLFHKLIDIVAKRKTSFESKKFGNGLFVAIK